MTLTRHQRIFLDLKGRLITWKRGDSFGFSCGVGTVTSTGYDYKGNDVFRIGTDFECPGTFSSAPEITMQDLNDYFYYYDETADEWRPCSNIIGMYQNGESDEK